MSGLNFLALVLQSSNSFDMKAFFQVFLCVILTVYKGDIQLMALGSWCPTGVFWKFGIDVVVLFFVWNLQTVFPLKPMFSEGPSIFVPFFVMMGLWVFAFMWYPCCVTTSQDYIKVEHIRTWLFSSSLAKFQQFSYERLLSSFSLCNSYCIQGWYSVDGFRVLVSHWGFLKVRE